MERIENNRTLDTKEWAISIFISSLPLIGFIMLLVWALSDETNIHKKNWAKRNPYHLGHRAYYRACFFILVWRNSLVFKYVELIQSVAK